ncbi:MAG: hypothetical protein AABX39_01325 [Nanoarchaeota archaeon]
MKLFSNKRGVTPLIATGLLVFLAVSLAFAVITITEAYIEERSNVEGLPEGVSGCDAVNFKVTKISGIEHVCLAESHVDVSIDNGKAIEIYDFLAKIHGSKSVANIHPVLINSLKKSEGVRLSLQFKEIGTPLQVSLMPQIRIGKNILDCDKKMIVVEKLPSCE